MPVRERACGEKRTCDLFALVISAFGFGIFRKSPFAAAIVKRSSESSIYQLRRVTSTASGAKWPLQTSCKWTTNQSTKCALLHVVPPYPSTCSDRPPTSLCTLHAVCGSHTRDILCVSQRCFPQNQQAAALYKEAQQAMAQDDFSRARRKLRQAHQADPQVTCNSI